MSSTAPEDPAGSFEEALANGRRLLDSDPARALDQAQALLRAGPDSRAFRLAAAALRKLDRTAEAVSAELAGIQAGFRDSTLEQAAIAEMEGRSLEAKAILDEYLQRRPDDLLALTLAGETATSLWDLEHAEEMLLCVLERAPTFLRASMLLAKCLAKQARLGDAVAVLAEVVERKPDNQAALSYIANLQAELGDIAGAAKTYERLASLDGRNPGRWVTLAQYYRILTRADESKSAFRKALALDPANGAAWWGLANYFASSLDSSDEQAMRGALGRKTDELDAGVLHLALGIVADRAGDHPRAFHHFTAGKRIRLAAQPYDRDILSNEVDGLARLFAAGTLDPRQGASDPSPIFIVGMPRSGSTLVERILGRHSAIEAAGELPIMPRLAERARHRTIGRTQGYAEMLTSLSPAERAEIGMRYIERSRDHRRTAKPRFTDKLNLNWQHVGLIRAALPGARIIDVRRGGLDCCWSNFKMPFTDSHPAANDLDHLGRFYRDYARLVDAAAEAAPGRILKVRYEDVVEDIESSARLMLDFLDLPYEPHCIDFHLGTEPVATASSEQVRRPLNREGIGAAEPYRQWLGVLITELGPLAG